LQLGNVKFYIFFVQNYFTHSLRLRLQLFRVADLSERVVWRTLAPGATEHGCCR
jgi:hypothetical protein